MKSPEAMQEIRAMLPLEGQQALGKIAQMWPKLDGLDQDSQRDFFSILTHSWVTYSGTMTEAQKQQMMDNLSLELQTRAKAMVALYGDAESSPSEPPQT